MRTAPKEEKKERLFHALKMQRTLSQVGYGYRNAVKSRIADVESFEDFPLLPAIQESIKKEAFPTLESITPSAVQRLAIPAIMGTDKKGRFHLGQTNQTEQFLIAAETGSGKTLGYLLPVLDAIKRIEEADTQDEVKEKARMAERKRKDRHFIEPPPLDDRPNSSTARPRAIILVPTSELVAQVTSLVKAFSHTVKFKAAGISSAFSPKVIRNRLLSSSGIDLVVSTPQLLSSICESEPNLLSRVSHIVVDEADSLLDRSFSPATTSIIDRAGSSLHQLILCSATIPRSLDNTLRNRYPDIRRLVTPNLHAIPRRVQLSVVDVERDPYRGNKKLACADAIWQIGKAGEESRTSPTEADADSFLLKRLLVFVNERESTAEVAEYLQSKGIDAVALTRDTPEQRQSELLASFTMQPTSKPEPIKADEPAVYVPAHRQAAPRRDLPNTKVLVTTDLGSRGIDSVAVRHVILYDVPHSTIDFIHRLGRTGRYNRRGRGIVLVGKHDRRDVVREVRDAMFRGQALI